MADYKDILLENKQELSDDDLLKYLDQNTPEEEKHVIEKKLINTSFESDAVEGLQQISDPQKLKKHVGQLNKTLHQHLRGKKQRPKKGKINNFFWVVLTILLLLFICLTGYSLITMYQNR